MKSAPPAALLRPRWSKVLADLWGDKVRTLLVVASITVGVFAIGMILSAYRVLAEDFNRSYAAANPPNIEIWTDPFEAELVKVIARVPGVRQVQGARLLTVRARRGQEAWQTLDLMGVSDFASGINRVTPVEGTVSAGPAEIVVSQDFLHVTGYHGGEQIELEFAGGVRHTVRVAGLIQDQTKARPDPGAMNYASLTLKTLDDFGQATAFNRLYITVTGDGSRPEQIAAVAARVKDRLEKGQRRVYRCQEQVSDRSPLENLALTVMHMLLVLGGLTALLSSTLIINMLHALLTQQMRQIGVMKLVGGRSRQVMGMYLLLVGAYSVLALIPAVPLGAAAGYRLALYIATTSGARLQGFRFFPLVVAVQALMAFLIPLAAGYLPVRSGARTSVQQAISNVRSDEVFSSRGLFGRGTQWLSRVSRPALVALRNTFRKKGRLLLTLFTLTVAGAVFMAVFNIRGSLEGILDQLLQHFMGDVTLEFRRPYRVAEIERAVRAVPGVSGVEPWSGAAGEVLATDRRVLTRLAIAAPPQATQLLRLQLSSGRWLLPGEERALLVSDTIHQYVPGLQPGDRLQIRLPGRHVEEWTVVGIFPFLSLFGDPIAYASYEAIAAQNFTPNQAAAYRIIADPAQGGPAPALIRRLEQHLAGQNFQVLKIQSGAAFRETAAAAIDMLIAFLLIMAILIAVVGSIGLAGTMSMNVLERRREIGVMRTIGASDGAILQAVVTEALVIGLLTWVLAIGLSFPISSLLAAVIGETLLETTLPLRFTPLGILAWLGIVVVLAVLASALPAHSAARLTINEVLAYE